jgi:hypothetical protein
LPHRSCLVMHRPLTELSASCFSCASSLLAQPFDERRLEPIGEPIPIAKQVGKLLSFCIFSRRQRSPGLSCRLLCFTAELARSEWQRNK